jgi:hypothetical protein
MSHSFGEMFAKDIFDKVLLSKIFKELLQLNNVKNLIKKWTKITEHSLTHTDSKLKWQ